MFELVERYISTFLLSHKMALRKKKKSFIWYTLSCYTSTPYQKLQKKKEKQIGLWIGLGGLIANNKF
jgi:hypothetical protein